MKRLPPNPTYAVQETVLDLARQFQYPDIDTFGPASQPVGGGGMAHVLIVSTTEPEDIQAKADYVVEWQNCSVALQAIFDDIDDMSGFFGAWSIWMAGVFDLDADVTAPPRAWIRGLGPASAEV